MGEQKHHRNKTDSAAVMVTKDIIIQAHTNASAAQTNSTPSYPKPIAAETGTVDGDSESLPVNKDKHWVGDQDNLPDRLYKSGTTLANLTAPKDNSTLMVVVPDKNSSLSVASNFTVP